MNNVIELVDESRFAEVMRESVEPYLATIRQDGYFNSTDGKKLHYEAHLIENARGNIVLCHGFTESAEKFREMAYYFTGNGFNTFALDHRGHGYSYRMAGDKETVRLGKFSEYIEDLNVFVNDVVSPLSEGLPMYVFGHSMGGGIVARYIQVYPEVFEKAILSSPMICAQAGAPIPLAKAIMKFTNAIGLKNVSVPTMCKFNPNATYENSSDTSKARFEYYLEKRRRDPNLRTTGPAFGWVNEALRLTDHLLDDNNCKRVSADVVIYQPEQDARVISSYQDVFARKLAKAKIVHIANSKHEIFATTNDVMKGYLDSIFDFLG